LKQKTDSHYMEMALGLARRGLGSTWPNPSVGCIIVDQKGHVVGRGYTGQGGKPHGEITALKQAGRAAKGSTAYVTLEPCAHYGKTPPCAEALLKAQISRVVVATIDPDERTSGKGMEILKKAAVQVDLGVCQTEAKAINQGFFKRITASKPFVTLKVATSLDGMIAASSGQDGWITGPESRRRGHLLRANHDAILVGVGTVLADNPSLDCRLPGLENRSPVRIILDSSLRTPDDCTVVNTANSIPTWIITGQGNDQKKALLEKKSVQIICCDLNQKGQIDLEKMMPMLAAKGLTRILSEGGAQVNASLIKASLVDRLYWFRSTDIIGGDGLPALSSIGLTELLKMPQFSLIRTGRTGKDIWQEYRI